MLSGGAIATWRASTCRRVASYQSIGFGERVQAKFLPERLQAVQRRDFHQDGAIGSHSHVVTDAKTDLDALAVALLES